jgi:hypothetical protein
MDAEAKGLLQRLVTLTEENNAILKKLHRAHVWNRIFFIVRVIVFVLISLGLYYYVNVYFDRIRNIYNQTTGTVQNFGDIQQYKMMLGDLLKKIETTTPSK